MIWNEARECMSRDELMHLQGERLAALAKRMYYGVEYYRKKMQHVGIEPGDVRGIEDLNKLPFTTKEDLQQAAPFELLAVPQSEIVRRQISRETTDKEIITGCTRNDLEIWTECLARCIHMAGFGKNDTILIDYNYGFSTDELGVHRGVEKVGAAAMTGTMCSTRNMVSMMKNLNITGIICAPSYLMHIGQLLESMGEVKNLKLKAAICLSEPWSEFMKKEIERMLNIDAYNIYGVNELAGLGMSCDCRYHNGFHVQEDYFITEVLHKDTNNEVKDGEGGEPVFTTLQREGMPLLRYRTGEMVSITRKKCGCGRTTARMHMPGYKINNMYTIRGVGIFQFEIENVLIKLYDIGARYLVRIYTEAKLDMVDVLVELSESDRVYFMGQEEMIKQRVGEAVRSVVGVAPKVYLAEDGAVPRTAGRISTVADDRAERKV